MDRSDLARRIKSASYLTGQFRLRSGRASPFCWDKYRFESDPQLLSSIVEELGKLLPSTFDKLAGLELGGIPLATGLSLKAGKACLYVRKEAKAYGTCNLVEGGFRQGEMAVVVEDVVTTAGQVCESIGKMRDAGLTVQNAVCVIDREQGGAENLRKIGCTLGSIFTLTEIEELSGH